MIRCTFCLNGNQLSNLSCPGIGFFPAYSGTGTSRNDPDAVAVPSIGPLPTGLYYIVTRGTGGVVTMVSDSLALFISGISTYNRTNTTVNSNACPNHNSTYCIGFISTPVRYRKQLMTLLPVLWAY